MNKSISAAKAVHKIVFPHYAITMQIELGSLCAAGFPFSFSFFSARILHVRWTFSKLMFPYIVEKLIHTDKLKFESHQIKNIPLLYLIKGVFKF